jgi:hypothetical protein
MTQIPISNILDETEKPGPYSVTLTFDRLAKIYRNGDNVVTLKSGPENYIAKFFANRKNITIQLSFVKLNDIVDLKSREIDLEIAFELNFSQQIVGRMCLIDDVKVYSTKNNKRSSNNGGATNTNNRPPLKNGSLRRTNNTNNSIHNAVNIITEMSTKITTKLNKNLPSAVLREDWRSCPSVQKAFAKVPGCEVTKNSLLITNYTNLVDIISNLINQKPNRRLRYFIIDVTIKHNGYHAIVVLIDYTHRQVIFFDPHGDTANKSLYNGLAPNILGFEVVEPSRFGCFQCKIDQKGEPGSCSISCIFPIYILVITQKPFIKVIETLLRIPPQKLRDAVFGMLKLLYNSQRNNISPLQYLTNLKLNNTYIASSSNNLPYRNRFTRNLT